MLDPEIEEEEEINQLADEEEAEEPEETLRERQIREAAERQAALLAGTGREMYELAGIDPERAAESDVAKLVIEQTQDVLDRNQAESQAVRDEQEEYELLDVERLLARVQTGRDSLAEGLRTYDTPSSVLQNHAESLDMSVSEYRERAVGFGVPLDGMIDQVAYQNRESSEVLETTRRYNPLMGTPEERVSFQRQEFAEERLVEEFRERGIELPGYLAEDNYVFDDETSSIFGTDMADVESLSIEGDSSYTAATLRSQELMSDPTVAQYVRDFESNQLGGEDYFRSRIDDLMSAYRRDNSDSTGDQRDAVYIQYSNQIMAELASLKTVGLWTMPIFLRRERIDALGYDYGAGDTSWLQAFSPRIEVIGVHRRGGGRTFVLRQAGALDTLFRAIDAPKSALLGAIKYGGMRGARIGVAEGIQAMDYFGESAEQRNWGTFWTSTAYLTGLAVDILAPDALVGAALFGAGARGAARVAMVAREAPGFTRDIERLLEAYKEAGTTLEASEQFARIEREMAVKYPILIDRVDSYQTDLTELMKGMNPDIADRSLAAQLPGKAGELEVNLAPELRRERSRLTGEVEVEGVAPGTTRTAREPVSQPLYTRGYNSTIDDFHYQRQVVQDELDKLDAGTVVTWTQYAPQANRVLAPFRDRIDELLIGIADEGESTLIAERLSNTVEDLLRDPKQWRRDTQEFVRSQVASITRDPRQRSSESLAKFLVRMGDTISPEEIKLLKRNRDIRKTIKDELLGAQNDVIRLRNRLNLKGLDPADIIKQQRIALNKAMQAVKTNQEARIGAMYLVYTETHGWASILKKPLGLGKMKDNLIDSDLFADLDQYRELSAEASFFSSEMRNVFTNIDRRQSLVLARLMDARARTWATKNERTVSEWWELNFGRIESKGDMRRALRARGSGGGGARPTARPDADDVDAVDDVDGARPDADDIDVDDVDGARPDADAVDDVDGARPDADDVDADVDGVSGDDGGGLIHEEPPIDEDAFVDAPDYVAPPKPSVVGTVLENSPAGFRKTLPSADRVPGYTTGSRLGFSKRELTQLDGPSTPFNDNKGHPPEFLYNHLVQFDSRINPDSGGTLAVLGWLSKHAEHPAARVMAQRLKKITPNERFYIQDAGSRSMLSFTTKGRKIHPGAGGIFGAPSSDIDNFVRPVRAKRVLAHRGNGYVVVKGAGGLSDVCGLSEETLLHELLHSATVSLINRPPTVAAQKAVKRLDDLGQDVLSYARKVTTDLTTKAMERAYKSDKPLEELNAWYDPKFRQEFLEPAEIERYKRAAFVQESGVLGRSDGAATELITYGLTSSYVQKFLLEMPIKKVRKGLQEHNGFTRFVELVASLLGSVAKKFSKPEVSVLHRVMALSDEVLTAKTEAPQLLSRVGASEVAEISEDLSRSVDNIQYIIRDQEALYTKEQAKTLSAGFVDNVLGGSIDFNLLSPLEPFLGKDSYTSLRDLILDSNQENSLIGVIGTLTRKATDPKAPLRANTAEYADLNEKITLLSEVSLRALRERRDAPGFQEALGRNFPNEGLLDDVNGALDILENTLEDLLPLSKRDGGVLSPPSVDDIEIIPARPRDAPTGPGFMAPGSMPELRFGEYTSSSWAETADSIASSSNRLKRAVAVEASISELISTNTVTALEEGIDLLEDVTFQKLRKNKETAEEVVSSFTKTRDALRNEIAGIDDVYRDDPYFPVEVRDFREQCVNLSESLDQNITNLSKAQREADQGVERTLREQAGSRQLPEDQDLDLTDPRSWKDVSPSESETAAAPAALPPSGSRLVQDNYLGDLNRFSPTMYREVSGSEVLSFLPGARSRVDMRRETFFSNDPTLALAQGRGGFVVEVESSGLQGKLSKRKPGWQASYDQFGTAEFIAKHNEQALYQGAVRSIEVKPNAQISRSERARLRRGLSEWNKTELPDGTVRYTPPRADVPPEVQKSAAPVRADIDTPEFRNWFGDSKVVDDAGEPLVMYHGSGVPNIDQFKETEAGGLFWFTQDRDVAENYAFNRLGVNVYDEDAWDDAIEAGVYDDVKQNYVVDSYLSVQNPLDLRNRESYRAIAEIDPEFGSAYNEIGEKYTQRIISAAKRASEGDVGAEMYFWTLTKDERVHKAWANRIVPQLQARGYDGLIMPDAPDTGLSYAVFEPTQIKSVYNRGTFDPSDARVTQSTAPPVPPVAPTAVPPTGPGLSMRMLNDIEDGRAVIRAFDDSDTFVDLLQGIGQVIRRDMDPQELDELLVFLKGPPHKLDVDVRGANFIGPDAARAEQIFAQSFERYVRGGREVAPSKGLRSVFQHCRRILADIYVGLRADRNLDIQIAPEVKSIMDRMLTETPSYSGISNFRRALVTNMRNAPGVRFDGLGKATRDRPIGVNAELGAVSVAARISEELRRLVKPSDSGVRALTETEIADQIDDLIKQVSNPGSGLTGADVTLKLDTPVLRRVYGPAGKDEFSLDELVSLQSRLEAERAEALTETLPGAFEQSRRAAFEELTATEQLRSLVKPGSFSQAVLFTFFGGDPAALGKISLRGLPPMVRAEVTGGGKVIEEAYGNIIRLIREDDMDKVSEFLGGGVVDFGFGGRSAFSSGYDSFGAVARQLAKAMEDIEVTTVNGKKLRGPELIERLERFIETTHPSEATRAMYKQKLPVVALDDALVAKAYNDTVRMLFAQMDPSKSTSFTRDIGTALGITTNPTGGQQLVFAESLLYYMGITRRNGKNVIDNMPTGALVDKTAEEAMVTFQKNRARNFLDEIENAYKSKPGARPTTESIGNRNRVAVLIAGHGQVERVIRNMHARGLAVSEIDHTNFLRWQEGLPLSPREIIGVQKLIRKFGLNPSLAEDPLLAAGTFLPSAARKRISEALARGMDLPSGNLRQLGINASEQDITGAFGVMSRYMKLRMTRGAVFLRQRYFFMNFLDHISQLAYKAGFRLALVSGIRVASTSFMVLPGVSRGLALLEVGGVLKPGAMERFRRTLQKGGDKAARAAATLLRVSVYRVDLNDVLNGTQGYVRLGKRVYSNRQIREIMVEEGIFASFDTRALADVIRQDVTKSTTKIGRAANNVLLQSVTDTAEAWSERERAGAVLTLIESGLSPRAACRVTIDALFDYAGTMSKVDRSWWMSLLFPFWAFQKNANAQVFNLAFSPSGAYRMGVVRRFLEGGPDAFGQLLALQLSENPETGIPTPYGIYLGGLTQQQRELYYEVVRRIEFGYGPLAEMSPETLRMVLDSYAVNRIEDLNPQQVQIIENGYGPAYTMPEETRQAISSMFSGAEEGRVVGGTYLSAEEGPGMADLISQTGLIQTAPGERFRGVGQSRRDFDDFIRMTRQVSMPLMGENEIRAYMKNRGRLPIPPVLNERTREYYETLRRFNGLRGEIESPYLELLLPDSTINAGFRHLTNLAATYTLVAYGVLAPIARMGTEALRTPSTLDDYEIDSASVALERGISPMTPFREVLDIESTPIPGPILESITDERIGYPRRVHPLIGSMFETNFPGYSVLRIDPSVAEQADPYLDSEAMTFASQEEYDQFRESGNRQVTIMQERVYLPPGIGRFMFENSPLGELNRILMTMPTKIPFTDIGLGEGAETSIDYRSMYEQVQDPEQLIQWSRFILGLDVKETSPTRTARIEEREIPDELQ